MLVASKAWMSSFAEVADEQYRVVAGRAEAGEVLRMDRPPSATSLPRIAASRPRASPPPVRS
jgi:hypothetical protein